MADVEKAIKDVEEIRSKLIPAIARMYGSGFSSVFACDKAEEKLNNAIELLKSKQAEIERLEKENGTLKLAVQSMPNWLDEKRPEVVRCKDCKYWDYLIAGRGRCDEMSVTHVGEFYTDSDWYCADGERKDGDGE